MLNKKLTFLSLAHCWPCWTIVPGVHWWEPRSGDRSPLTPSARRANACEAHQVTKPTKCSKRLKIMHYCVMYCVTWSECKCHDLLPSFFIADLLASKIAPWLFDVFLGNLLVSFWCPKIAPRLFDVLFAPFCPPFGSAAKKRREKVAEDILDSNRLSW